MVLIHDQDDGMKKALLVLMIALLSGCATGEKASKLEPGMSRAQLDAVMGRPDGYQQRDGYEILKYSNRLMSGWSWDRTDYVVLMKDGRVVEYGNGEVRERSPNAGVLVIAPIR